MTSNKDAFIFAFIYLFMNLYIWGHFYPETHIQGINLYMHLFMYNECKDRVHCLVYYIKLVQNDVYLNKFPNT